MRVPPESQGELTKSWLECFIFQVKRGTLTMFQNKRPSSRLLSHAKSEHWECMFGASNLLLTASCWPQAHFFLSKHILGTLSLSLESVFEVNFFRLFSSGPFSRFVEAHKGILRLFPPSLLAVASILLVGWNGERRRWRRLQAGNAFWLDD